MSSRRFHLVGCSVLRDETEALIAELGLSIPCEWIELGLHDDVERMRAEIRAAVERQRGRTDLDAILLQYGLCSHGVAGIEAPGVPLVIPRVHDCISLFLGGAQRYREEHEKEPGTYWFSRGFLDRRDDKGGQMIGIGSGQGPAAEREKVYQEYLEKYGEENAKYLMETLVDAWKKNYTRAVYLAPGPSGGEPGRRRVQDIAAENGWRYEEMPLNLRMLRMLLTGDWPEAEFLIVPPGARVTASNDARVLACALGRPPGRL
jgi:hypothetical protein